MFPTKLTLGAAAAVALLATTTTSTLTTTNPCAYPANCPNKVLPRADKQTWSMNASTIIMPCNDTGFTDPSSTLGWSVVDFDWSNAKGTGPYDGWAKHSPMDDEEMLFKQVQITTAATSGTTVWVYRCSVYAYPWYVRKLLFCIRPSNIYIHVNHTYTHLFMDSFSLSFFSSFPSMFIFNKNTMWPGTQAYVFFLMIQRTHHGLLISKKRVHGFHPNVIIISTHQNVRITIICRYVLK